MRNGDEVGVCYVPAHEVAGYKVGDILGFAVSADDKGACARQVEQVEDDETEVAA